MTTIAEVRTALASAVGTITGFTTDAYQRDVVDAPAAQIMRREMDTRLILGSTKQAYAFTVRVYAARGVEDISQALLDEYCAMSGATSIKAAIENGANWAITVDYAQVTTVGETEVVEVAGVQYLTVDFAVEVVW